METRARQRVKLMPPGPPKLWKPVKQHDQRKVALLPRFDDVEVHVAESNALVPEGLLAASILLHRRLSQTGPSIAFALGHIPHAPGPCTKAGARSHNLALIALMQPISHFRPGSLDTRS